MLIAQSRSKHHSVCVPFSPYGSRKFGRFVHRIGGIVVVPGTPVAKMTGERRLTANSDTSGSENSGGAPSTAVFLINV